MQIRIIVEPLAPAPARHVVLDARPGSTAAELAVALGARRLVVGGLPVGDQVRVGMPPLLDGAAVGFRVGSAPAPPSGWELWVLAGPDAGLRFPVPLGRSVLGRARDAAVVLTDARVSRRHAQLEAGPGGVLTRDLGGTNGTRLCDAPLGSAARTLTDGGVLEVGDTRLVLHRTARGMPGVRPDGLGHLVVPTSPGSRPRPAAEVRFPDAPAPPSRSRLAVATLAVPLVLAGILALVMRSPAMLLFGLTGPALSLTTWLGERRHRRRRPDTSSGHEAALQAASATLDAALAADRSEHERNHPPPAAVLALAETRSAGLWGGSACVRVGTGSRPSRVRVAGGTAPPVPVHVAVPVTVDLATVGVLGMHGPRAKVLRAAAGLVGRLAVSRSPVELTVQVLGEDRTRGSDWDWDWDFAAYLPHVRVQHPVRAPPQGSLVVVIADRRAVGTVPEVDDLLRHRPDGVVVIALADEGGRLPVECRAVLDLATTPARLRTLCEDGDDMAEVDADLPSAAWAWRVARALAPLRDPRPAGREGGLPETVRLLDLVGPEALSALSRRWMPSERASTRVVLGATADGLLEVDLRADGPHVLVAGTTGAGKSELLQTLVCSLALANRPDQMSFLLLDYKGGAAFRGCAALPHVVGVVTDLDAHLTARALVSLTAELRRRERLLAEARAGSLDEYEDLRTADAGRPTVPRLVIVIDEFRVLAEELPDFVHGLVRLAAVGRSLGVHLVLATQRPGGVVSADIRANVSLRIALRVRDRADSTDVLDAPDAAQIGTGTPGRAFLRGAGTPLTQFQAARVTAPAHSEAALTVTDDAPWWAPTAATAPNHGPAAAGDRDLEHIVAAARAASATLRIPLPDAPWLPPLPDSVDVASLPRAAGSVAVGLEDDPQSQRQQPWCWAPANGGLGIAGGGRSGRTTAVLTVALSLAQAYAPTELHLYALGPPSLSVLAGLPHTATFAPLDDEDRVRLLLNRIRSIAGSRADRTVVVLVDGWEQLAALGQGAVAAELRVLLESGGSRGMRAVVTGGRAVLAGQLASLFARRLVLPVGDPVELALAGIPSKAVPAHQPPGRGLDPRTHHEVQVARFADIGASVRQMGAGWADQAGDPRLPDPVRPLPDRIAREELATAVSAVPIAVREGDLRAVGFDPGGGERRVLVVGGARSGRTTALATLAHGLADAGQPLALLGRELSDLAGHLPVVRVAADGRDDADRERLIAVRRDHPDLAVLVDDAERLAGLAVEPVLAEIARCADEDRGLVTAATTPAIADGRGGAFLADLARAHTGLVLSPTSTAALLGAVLPPMAQRPGRGFLVVAGVVTRVQVATLRP